VRQPLPCSTATVGHHSPQVLPRPPHSRGSRHTRWLAAVVAAATTAALLQRTTCVRAEGAEQPRNARTAHGPCHSGLWHARSREEGSNLSLLQHPVPAWAGSTGKGGSRDHDGALFSSHMRVGCCAALITCSMRVYLLIGVVPLSCRAVSGLKPRRAPPPPALRPAYWCWCVPTCVCIPVLPCTLHSHSLHSHCLLHTQHLLQYLLQLRALHRSGDLDAARRRLNEASLQQPSPSPRSAPLRQGCAGKSDCGWQPHSSRFSMSESCRSPPSPPGPWCPL
jgi:hypothetical protein